MPESSESSQEDTFLAWKTVLHYGRLAPTPHNTQWYYLHPRDETTADVCIDTSIKLPFTDPDDQFCHTGLGVFVRHLELAAEASGFVLESSNDSADPERPVTVRITGKRAPDTALAALLEQRQTSRLAYDAEPIGDEAIQALTSLTTGKNSIHISTNESTVRAVLNLNNTVLLNDLQDKGVGDELDNWIRYSKSAQAKTPSGFTPDTLASSAWKVWLVFRFRKVMQIGPMRSWLTKQYFKQNMTGTVGWLYGPLTSRQDQYEAGRFMMDVWLKVTELGYYMQPYGSIITNHEARAAFLQESGQTESDGNMVWLAFRVGKSKPPARAPRKSEGEYLR